MPQKALFPTFAIATSLVVSSIDEYHFPFEASKNPSSPHKVKALMPPAAQILNRSIFSGDNLPILRGMDSASVDLVYLDPPFNSNRNYAAPIGSAAAGAAFKDAWTFEDTDDAWWGEIAEVHPALYKVIDAAGAVGGAGAKAYLIYMAVRILEMQRILKKTGSLYLHCDPTMSHGLKLLLDAIFGADNFRNEIVWGYKTGGSSKGYFSKKHDVILFYSKTVEYIFIPQKEKSYTKAKNRKEGVVNYGGGSAQFFKDQKGVYNLVNMRDTWEISYIGSTDKERTGYPTQKPLALLERIIKASSNPDDMVLDPFCGCATTCIAAEILGRQWIGIDISELALQLVKDRMRREVNLGDEANPALLGRVIHRTDIPIRHASKPSRDIKRLLFGRQRGYCKGCKRDFPYQNLTKDHIIPTAKGGANTDENLQLLCHFCNSLKGSRLTMPELHATLKQRGMMA